MNGSSLPASPISGRDYRALLLDLDGTLVGRDDRVHPFTLVRVKEAARRGVCVMIATGRSEGGLRDVVEELQLESPVVCYNGAGLYDPVARTLHVEHELSTHVVDEALTFAEQPGVFAVSMVPGHKFALAPESNDLQVVLESFHDMEYVPASAMNPPGVIRLSLFSDRYPSSGAFAQAVSDAIGDDHYYTHFPLALLPGFQRSRHLIVDIHAPCAGKAEAYPVLESRFGIPPQAVVAIGDAENDRPMLEGAGLAVIMENAVSSLRDCAQRVIGDCNSDTIGHLIDELFLAKPA